MPVIIIDGVKTVLEAPDLDGDGVVGGVERVSQDLGIQPIKQNTELGDSLKELNKDELEKDTRMSGIDLRSRLHYVEIGYVLALDSLVALGVCPIKALSFTRQKKRLSVSLEGKGRDDIVNVVSGKREQDAKLSGGFLDRAKGFIGMGKGE